MGVDYTHWDQYENRFEANELKWISDYLINNLVFIKQELKIAEKEKVAKLLQVLWTTLDLFEA